MSTNLIYNVDFSLPSITTNSSINYTSFTTEQTTALYFTSGGVLYVIIEWSTNIEFYITSSNWLYSSLLSIVGIISSTIIHSAFHKFIYIEVSL